jgi:hypothetical protein
MKVKQQSCLNCDKEVSRKPKKYCNNFCQREFEYKEFVLKWKAGLVTATVGYSVSRHIRRYLFEKFNNACSICHWSKKNKTTGTIPLEIHHKDGSFRNSAEPNLDLLCPNCHALTPNAGSLNIGQGRSYKRIRIGV